MVRRYYRQEMNKILPRAYIRQLRKDYGMTWQEIGDKLYPNVKSKSGRRGMAQKAGKYPSEQPYALKYSSESTKLKYRKKMKDAGLTDLIPYGMWYSRENFRGKHGNTTPRHDTVCYFDITRDRQECEDWVVSRVPMRGGAHHQFNWERKELIGALTEGVTVVGSNKRGITEYHYKKVGDQVKQRYQQTQMNRWK